MRAAIYCQISFDLAGEEVPSHTRSRLDVTISARFTTTEAAAVRAAAERDVPRSPDDEQADQHEDVQASVRNTSVEVYNIDGNNERSNLDLTHSILKIMGKGHDMIRPVPDRPPGARRTSG